MNNLPLYAIIFIFHPNCCMKYIKTFKKKVVENNTFKGLIALGNILKIKKIYYLSLDSIV